MQKKIGRQLIAGLRAGDERACERLLDQYELPIYRFFYYSHGHHQTAQDQCGETFFRLMAAVQKDSLCDIRHLRAYLYGIARNIQAEYYRRQDFSCETISSEPPSPQPSVYRQVASQDELANVWRVIGQFDDPMRQILLLRFVDNIPYEEIAAIMAMPVNSVKSHIHRGRKKLIKILAETDSSDTRCHHV